MTMARTVPARPGSSASIAIRQGGNGNAMAATTAEMTYSSSSGGGTSGMTSVDNTLRSPARKPPMNLPSTFGVSNAEFKSSDTISQPHCSFCLVAEFDIDKGSTLSYQYPAPIGYDDHLLAELMLPDGVHARSEDWTVFFLPATSVSCEQRQDADTSLASNSSSQPCSPNDREGRRDELFYVLNLVRTKHDNTVRRGALVKAIAVGTRHPFIQVFKPALLLALDEYFRSPSLDVLARLFDTLNTIDLSLMPTLSRDEKLILRASDRRDLFAERFKEEPSTARAPSGLRHLTNMRDDEDQGHPVGQRSRSESTSTTQSSIADEANKGVASSSAIGTHAGRSTPHLPHRPSLASLRPGSGAAGLLKRRPSAANQLQLQQAGHEGSHISLPSLANWKKSNGASPSSMTPIQDGKIRDTHYWETNVTYGKIQDLPVRIPTDVFPEEVGEYSLADLFTTFAASTPSGPIHPHLHSNGLLTPPLILLFNAIVSGRRVVFLGHNQPASRVASHVLSACALGSGCGVAWRGIAKRCFPYANLGTIDELEKVPGFIAGVTNPRFEELPVWDVLFNIENGKVTVAKDIEPAPLLLPGISRPGMSQSLSTGSLGSSGAYSGAEIEAKLSRAPTESDATSAGLSSNSMVRTRERAGTVLEPARVDAPDNLFVEELHAAITARYGERYIRSKCTDWALNFLRQVARHEEHFYGEAGAGVAHSQPYLNGQLGSGLVSADKEAGVREISANAPRIEAFRATDAYKFYRLDEVKRERSRTITGFDLHHQLSRLRRARRLASGESELIFVTIARAVRSPEQIVELLAMLPPHQGGLTPLACGLLHSAHPIRVATHDLLLRLTMNPVGKKFIQSLNLYHRLAFARLLHEASEAQQGLTINSSNTPNNSAQRYPQYQQFPAAPNTAAQSGHHPAGTSIRDGLPSSNATHGHPSLPFSSREGMPITDALSSSFSSYSRSASPAYF